MKNIIFSKYPHIVDILDEMFILCSDSESEESILDLDAEFEEA